MSKTKSWRFVVPALAGALALAACGSSDDALNGKVVKEGIVCSVDSVDRKPEAPTVEPIDSIEKTSHKDLVTGKGCATDYARYLQFDILGATAADGKVFYSSWDSDRPVTVQLGSGRLLPALEAQITGMKVGGRRLVTVPAAEAYGKDGNPAQGIGPDQDLEFVVDFIAAEDEQTYCNAATGIPEGAVPGKPLLVDMPLKPVTELVSKDLQVGTGATVGENQYVKVHYLGVACSTGQQFDSSWDRGEPIEVALGTAPPTDEIFNVIPGWEGLKGAKVGGVRQLVIPPDLGYGPQGQGSIGPNETLVFVIEVLGVTEPPATTTTAAGDGATTTTTAEGSTTTTAPADATTTTAADDETSTTDGDDPGTTTTEP